MPHARARKFKHQPRLKAALQHWWQTFAMKADVLTNAPRVAPNAFTQRQKGKNKREREEGGADRETIRRTDTDRHRQTDRQIEKATDRE